jgi:hypothetical protein
MVANAALLAWNASLIALDLFGDPDLAESWLNRPECNLPEVGNQHAGIVILENKVRIAIVRKQAAAAQCALEKIALSSIDQTVPQRAAYFLAIQIGTAVLNANIDVLNELLPRALALTVYLDRMVSQDFFVYQVFDGLSFVGRHQEAKNVLIDYLGSTRRRTAGLPDYLVRSCSAIGLHSSGDSTNRAH